MAANQRAPEKRTASERERDWLVTLVRKYDDDGPFALLQRAVYWLRALTTDWRHSCTVGRMSRDIKRNPLQKTPAQIRKSCVLVSAASAIRARIKTHILSHLVCRIKLAGGFEALRSS